MCMQSFSKTSVKLTQIMIGNHSVTNGRKWSHKMVTVALTFDLVNLEINRCMKTNIDNVYAKFQYDIKLTKITTEKGSQKNSQRFLDLWPGYLQINRCLLTNIGVVYIKLQYDICQTDKDNDSVTDWRADRQSDGTRKDNLKI